MSRAKTRKPSAYRDLAAWAEPRPARRVLTRDEVVRCALEVLDREGFDGLTMRRLAERLGIQAASLYNHVRDKDELLALAAETICGAIPDLEPGKPWRSQLEVLGLAYRRALMSHRDGARVLAATPPAGPRRLRIIEQLLHTLRDAGLSAAETTDAGFVFNSYVVGFVLDETLGHPSTPAAMEQMREQARRWFKSLPQDEYPTVVSLADALVDGTSDRRFELGMTMLLDGLERRVAARERSAPAARRRR